MVLVDDFCGTGEPVFEESLIGWKPLLEVRGVGLFGVIGCAGQRHSGGGAVEAGEARIVDVGVEGAAKAVPPPVLGAVGRGAEVQAVGAGGGREFTDDV